jgi:hypothetical protein
MNNKKPIFTPMHTKVISLPSASLCNFYALLETFYITNNTVYCDDSKTNLLVDWISLETIPLSATVNDVFLIIIEPNTNEANIPEASKQKCLVCLKTTIEESLTALASPAELQSSHSKLFISKPRKPSALMAYFLSRHEENEHFFGRFSLVCVAILSVFVLEISAILRLILPAKTLYKEGSTDLLELGHIINGIIAASLVSTGAIAVPFFVDFLERHYFKETSFQANPNCFLTTLNDKGEVSRVSYEEMLFLRQTGLKKAKEK